MAAFKRRQCLFERESGWRAEQPVAHHIEARLWVAFPLPFGHVRGKNRRGVINWWVDGAMLPLRMAPEMGEERVLAIMPRPTVALHKVHSAVPARPRNPHALATLNIIIILRAVGQYHHRVQRHRLAFIAGAAENLVH